jgi:hypothetical protein
LPDEEERIRRRCPPVVVEDRRRGRVNASATAAGPDGDDDASLDDDNGNEVAKQGDDDDDDDDEAREDDDAMARRIVDVVAVAAAAARIIVVVRITTAVRCPPLVVLIVDSELFFFVWLLLLSWVSLGVPVGSGGGSRHVVLVHHVFVDGPRHGMYGGDDGFGEVPSRVRISMIIRQNRSVVDIRDIMTPTVTPRQGVSVKDNGGGMPMRSEVGGNRLAFPQIHLRRKRSTTESWVGGIWAGWIHTDFGHLREILNLSQEFRAIYRTSFLFPQHEREFIEFDLSPVWWNFSVRNNRCSQAMFTTGAQYVQDSRAIRIDLVDQLLDVDGQAEVVLDYPYQRLPLHVSTLVRPPPAGHERIDHVVLVILVLGPILLRFDDLEELAEVDRTAHVVVYLADHLE